MGVEKARDHRRHVPPTKDQRRGDAEESARHALGGRLYRFGIGGEGASRVGAEAPAALGRDQPPGGALDEARPEPCLKPGQGAGDRWRRASQLPRRAVEAPGVEDGDKDGKLVEAVHHCSCL
jgi:hypothetical protein